MGQGDHQGVLADQGSQANTINDWPLTLKSLTLWALNIVIAPILPHVLSHAVVWIGNSHAGKSPVSYALSSVVSALVDSGRQERVPELPDGQSSGLFPQVTTGISTSNTPLQSKPSRRWMELIGKPWPDTTHPHTRKISCARFAAIVTTARSSRP